MLAVSCDSACLTSSRLIISVGDVSLVLLCSSMSLAFVYLGVALLHSTFLFLFNVPHILPISSDFLRIVSLPFSFAVTTSALPPRCNKHYGSIHPVLRSQLLFVSVLITLSCFLPSHLLVLMFRFRVKKFVSDHAFEVCTTQKKTHTIKTNINEARCTCRLCSVGGEPCGYGKWYKNKKQMSHVLPDTSRTQQGLKYGLLVHLLWATPLSFTTHLQGTAHSKQSVWLKDIAMFSHTSTDYKKRQDRYVESTRPHLYFACTNVFMSRNGIKSSGKPSPGTGTRCQIPCTSVPHQRQNKSKNTSCVLQHSAVVPAGGQRLHTSRWIMIWTNFEVNFVTTLNSTFIPSFGRFKSLEAIYSC